MATKPVKEEAKSTRASKDREIDIEKQRKQEALKRCVD